VSRFSEMAVVAVAVLVASGSFRSWAEVRTLGALAGTGYGIALLTKVAVFLPMVGFGAFNKLWLKPRLERAAGSPERRGAPEVTLRRLITLELGFGAVVLALTAVLVNMSPPGT
jgi:putative copper export protein